MRLIGMLDSPYVRRVAVSLKLMQLPFELEQLSVFRNFEQFQAINPVVKAPTLVTDEGAVLMDSTLILDHVERLAIGGPVDDVTGRKSLGVEEFARRQHAHADIGDLVFLALDRHQAHPRLGGQRMHRVGNALIADGFQVSQQLHDFFLAHVPGKAGHDVLVTAGDLFAGQQNGVAHVLVVRDDYLTVGKRNGFSVNAFERRRMKLRGRAVAAAAAAIVKQLLARFDK